MLKVEYYNFITNPKDLKQYINKKNLSRLRYCVLGKYTQTYANPRLTQ